MTLGHWSDRLIYVGNPNEDTELVILRTLSETFEDTILIRGQYICLCPDGVVRLVFTFAPSAKILDPYAFF